MSIRTESVFDIPRITAVSVFLCMLIAIVVLAGWAFNLELLKTFNPNWPSVKANTAIGSIASGISLILFIRKRNKLALILATIVFLIGTVTLSEYLFNFDAHIDELLFFDHGTSLYQHHGRMAQLTTVAFILIAISLLTYSVKAKWAQGLSEICAILLFIFSATGFIGVMYNAGAHFRVTNFASFSLPTAVSGLLMSMGILFSKPDNGFLKVFQKQTAVAKAGIKGILIIIIILLAIGWLCLKGEENGIFTSEMGFVIMIILFITSFVFIARLGIQRLNQAEVQLTLSEKNLRHVLSSTADIFYVIDKNYRITLINETAEKELHKTWGKSLKPGDNILDFIPDEKDEPILKSFEKVFVGERVEYELYSSRENIAEWYLVNYSPVNNENGAIIGAYVVTKNITERKNAEEKLLISELGYRSLIEQASDYVIICDNQGYLIDVNSSLCNTFGYTREELLGANISKIIDPVQLRNDPIRFDLLMKGQSMLRERRMMNRDGAIIEVEANVKMLPDGRILAIARDMTERKKIEEQIKQSYEQIRRLTEHLQNIREEERTHIAREIHDELGQQLTVLKVDAAWLINKIGSMDEKARRKIEGMLELLDNTVNTVRRISSELRPSILDDMGLVPAMEWHLKEFGKRTKLKTKLTAPGQELLFTNTVTTGLFRIFQESLTNVARHANAKNVEVSLNEQGGYIILSIKDDGMGFEKEKTAGKKTLGILGMKERSFMMGGSYQINSMPGEGALVIVSVPYLKE